MIQRPVADLPSSGKRRSLVARTVDELAARIRRGDLRPGDKLPTEPELMSQLEVSRTVLREALSRLSVAGLVRTRHGVGTFVAAGTDEVFPAIAGVATVADTLAILELRISLETEAAGLAARRRTAAHLAAMRGAIDDFDSAIAGGRDGVDEDFRFHCSVAAATANRYFEDMLRHLGTATIPRTRLRIALASTPSGAEYLRNSNREHKAILEAVANGDVDGARAAMRTHLAVSSDRLRRAYDPGADGPG